LILEGCKSETVTPKILMIKYQNYISEELIHFLGRSLNGDDDRYNLLVEIIKTGILRNGNVNKKGVCVTTCFHGRKISSNDAFNPNIVCFCDIPIADINIHMNKYSYFGISFKKHFLIQQGVRPVYYIPQNAIINNKRNLNEIFDEALRKYHQLDLKDDKIFDLKSFFTFQIFSFFKFFDPDLDDDNENNFYMEREWRGLERIEFSLDNISQIIIPSKYLKYFFKDFPDYNSKIYTPI
jgi:hypothetical protein